MKKKSKKLITEMIDETNDIIVETSKSVDDLYKDIPIAQGINLEELTQGDSDPIFVVVDALNDTISGNGNRWTPEIIKSVEKQVMEKTPDAYLGHIPDEQRSTLFPNPQTIWIGAKTVSDPKTGKTNLLVKGYVLPGTEMYNYLKKARAIKGKGVGVSVYGSAQRAWNKFDKCYDIKGFNLESIDWAREGSQGVANAGVRAITSETMKIKDVVANLTLDELQEYNPDLVQEIENTTKENVLKETKQDDDEEVSALKEMKQNIVNELGEQPLEAVAEMRAENGKLAERLSLSVIDSKLHDSVQSENARAFIKKMVISEMQSVSLSSDEESEAQAKGLTVAEMKAEKAVSQVLESDEAKAVILEMVSRKPFSPEHKKEETTQNRKYTVVV